MRTAMAKYENGGGESSDPNQNFYEFYPRINQNQKYDMIKL